ncbi:radical SAM/SPASM domain-containing protein [Clostridium grantii]|uniref:Radical SAM superfamily enzyme, MoaA/NifB/PqqE/SkfB family n=1 Tax=Clostridium grantii DSM 8605 TaxID=1121316 RepID=A0A1M5T145_9CLOT|nr:radical SAM protein [Clostridium grantii]SHH44360.1 Radical SAM superfamily enzyme, MoaA/NifB/PqqE/SkfB family [Clostridium grantii DSM 8605]
MKQFKRIYIEITNYCNLKCSFCPETKRKLEYMTVDKFEEVLKKIQGYGQYVFLHLKGEPLLHPQFKEILDLCYKYKVKVNLTTNGTMIMKHMGLLLSSKAIRQVSMSLQSYENLKDYEAFETYLKSIISFVNKGREKTNIIFELRLWNYEDEESVINNFNKNKKSLEHIKESLELKDGVYEQLPKGKGIKLLPQVYLSKSYEFQWPNLSREIISTKGSCYGLRQQIGILVNGDVVPCCLDSDGDIVLGNLFNCSFEEIINSCRAKAIVDGFETKKLVEPLCMRCGYRQRF